MLEGRTPAFVGDSGLHHFGGGKYLWGNMPAFDTIRLRENEGDDYGRPLNLLFAGELTHINTFPFAAILEQN